MMNLPCRRGDVCLVASGMASQIGIDREITTTDSSCGNCLRCSSFPGAEKQSPQSPNFITLTRLRTQIPESQRAVDLEFGHLRRAVSVQGPPAVGPGTELFLLFRSLRVRIKKKCKCKRIKARMNQLGAKGCRENRSELLAALRKNAKRYNWADKIKAAAAAVKLGIAHRIDLTDPIAWCFDFAVATAEQKQAQARR